MVKTRTWIMYLCLLILSMSLSLRTFISILIKPMSTVQGNETGFNDEYRLEWMHREKGMVLVSPLFGCTLALPLYMRFLADKVSPKMIVTCVLVLQSLLTALSPIAAQWSYYAFNTIRFIIGLAEGCVQSSLNTIVTAWFPPAEKVFTIAVYTCGFQVAFGGVQFPISYLIKWGVPWPYIYYAASAFGFLFTIGWWFLVSDKPSECKFLSKSEFNEITEKIPHIGKKPDSTPWMSILTSTVIISHLMCMIGFYFSIGVTSSLFPLYFNKELHMTTIMAGWFTLAPFSVQLLSKFVTGYVVDLLKRKGILTHTKAAKICQSIGAFVSALCLIALPFCHSYVPIMIALVLYGASFSCCVCGFYTTMTMVAPRYTGTISALVTFVGMLTALLSIVLFTVFEKYEVESKFYILFSTAAALQIAGGISYLIFGTGTVQEWAIDKKPPPMEMNRLLDTNNNNNNNIDEDKALPKDSHGALPYIDA